MLIANYNHYMDMLRTVTGLNEARDASTPDPNSLVGLQKLAALNSNTATRHILYAGLYIFRSIAERAMPPSAIVKSPERNPETYLGSARSERLASADPGENVAWKLPLRLGRYEWALEGAWKQDAEYVEAGPSGVLTLDFRAREVFVVASLADGSTGTLKVTVEDKAYFWSAGTPSSKEIVVDKDSLYRLFSASKTTKGVLRIQASPGVRLHAFTFS
jgi:hypothetical protein